MHFTKGNTECGGADWIMNTSENNVKHARHEKQLLAVEQPPREPNLNLIIMQKPFLKQFWFGLTSFDVRVTQTDELKTKVPAQKNPILQSSRA